MRSLRTAIMRQLRLGRKSYLVTSSWPKDGKSTLCLNLGFALAETSLRVLLVDGDLRTRTLTHWLVGTQLDSQLTLQRPVKFPQVSLVAAPATDGLSPADVLVRPEFRPTLQAFFDDFDVVLVDTPSLATCSDALLTGRWVDGALMVVSQARFQGVPEGNFSEDLRASGIELFGVVLNGV